MGNAPVPHPDDYAAIEKLLTISPMEEANLILEVGAEAAEKMAAAFAEYELQDAIEESSYMIATARVLYILGRHLPALFNTDIVLEAARHNDMIHRIVMEECDNHMGETEA